MSGMNGMRGFELGGFALAITAVAYAAFVLAPESPLRHLGEPAYLAMPAAIGVLGLLLALRLRARCSLRLESALLAAFLAGMPVVYLWSALRVPGGAVALESVGLLIFAAIAVLGYARRSLLLLAFGIAAHGLLWDFWRHGRAGYIEPWYPMGCLLVDVALALLVLAMASAARDAARSGAPQ
jgi:hypothetical protein